MPDLTKDIEIQEVGEEQEGKKRKKGKWIFFLIILIITGLLFVMMYFDIAKIRSQHTSKLISKIPIIKNLVMTSDEGKNRVETEKKQLEEEIIRIQQEYKELQERNQEAEKEIKRLKEIESLQIAFEKEKEEFALLILSQDTFDPVAYQTIYEKLNPGTAEIVYRGAIEKTEFTKKIKQYVATFEEMDESNAAVILEELGQTDIELVVLILQHIDVEQRARVLGEMKPVTAAAIAKLMAP